MKWILALVAVLFAGDAYAGDPDHFPTLTCYADEKGLFDKYPVTYTKMKCVTEIKNGIPVLSDSQLTRYFGDLVYSFDLVASYETGDKIIFIFKYKNQ